MTNNMKEGSSTLPASRVYLPGEGVDFASGLPFISANVDVWSSLEHGLAVRSTLLHGRLALVL